MASGPQGAVADYMVVCLLCRGKQLIVFFFFSRYGAHRDLHSFPTRRSSDLAVMPPGSRAPGPAAPGSRHRRSEEHTSELQSQSNLVCRLLLEKKKRCRPMRVVLHCAITTLPT